MTASRSISLSLSQDVAASSRDALPSRAPARATACPAWCFGVEMRQGRGEEQGEKEKVKKKRATVFFFSLSFFTSVEEKEKGKDRRRTSLYWRSLSLRAVARQVPSLAEEQALSKLLPPTGSRRKNAARVGTHGSIVVVIAAAISSDQRGCRRRRQP